MADYAYINGRVVQSAEAVLSVSDRAVLYGESLFESLRTFSGRAFLLDQHIERLRKGLVVLGLTLRESDDDLREALERVVSANGPGDQRVRITVTGGHGAGLVTSEPRCCSVIVTSVPLGADAPTRRELVFFPGERAGTAALARLKTGNYLASIEALRFARERGADDAVFTRGDLVMETAVANLFAVFGRDVATPPVEMGLLGGITRAFVMDCAENAGRPVIERVLTRTELLSADDLFVTNSVIGLVRIGRLEDRTFGEKATDRFVAMERLYTEAVARWVREGKA